MDNTIFPVQTKITNQKPFQLEFKQIKEYYNFQRKFKSDKDNSIKNQNPLPQKYYLIDKNWLNQWKEFVGFKKFCKMVSKRDVTDNDYNIFVECIPKEKKENKLSPLDNSKVYVNGEINPLAEFMIINKESYDAFNETRKNTAYYMNEKYIFLKFLHDSIIMTINNKIKIIFFYNEQLKCEDELIIIFINGNANKIISELENPDETFNFWIKNLDSYDYNSIDEQEFYKDNCKFKIINKRLKNLSFDSKGNTTKPTVLNNTTAVLIKYILPQFLTDALETQVKENISNTMTLIKHPKNNIQSNNNFINNENNKFPHNFQNNQINQFNNGFNIMPMPHNNIINQPNMNNMPMNPIQMQMNNMQMLMQMNNRQMQMNNMNNMGIQNNIFVNNMFPQNNNIMNPNLDGMKNFSCPNINNKMINNQNNSNNQNINNLKEINELKEKLNKANKIIEKQNKDIQDLKAQLNNIKTVYIDSNEINNLRNEINNKNNQINSLKQQLQNIKNNNGKIIQNKDKCVTFISQDSTLFFGVSCSGDSTFAEVEEKLYQEYPEYRETNNTFLAQGKIILRFKTIDQNNIGTGKPVILVRES